MTLLRSLRTTFSGLTSWLANLFSKKGQPSMSGEFDQILALPPSPGGVMDGTEEFEAVSHKIGSAGGYPNVRVSIALIVAWVSAALGVGVKAVTTVAGTTYTAAVADAAKWLDFTNAGAVTFTIDGNNAYPTDAEIEFSQSGAGAVTPVGANGVVIQSRGGAVATAGQYATAMLKRKGATNNWLFTGDIA